MEEKKDDVAGLTLIKLLNNGSLTKEETRLKHTSSLESGFSRETDKVMTQKEIQHGKKSCKEDQEQAQHFNKMMKLDAKNEVRRKSITFTQLQAL